MNDISSASGETGSQFDEIFPEAAPTERISRNSTANNNDNPSQNSTASLLDYSHVIHWMEDQLSIQVQ